MRKVTVTEYAESEVAAGIGYTGLQRLQVSVLTPDPH